MTTTPTETGNMVGATIAGYRDGYDSGFAAGRQDITDRLTPLMLHLNEQVSGLLAERTELQDMIRLLMPGGNMFDVSSIIDGRTHAEEQLMFAWSAEFKSREAGSLQELQELVGEPPSVDGLTGNDLVYATSFLAVLVAEVARELSADEEHAREALSVAMDRVDEHLTSTEKWETMFPGALDYVYNNDVEVVDLEPESDST